MSYGIYPPVAVGTVIDPADALGLVADPAEAFGADPVAADAVPSETSAAKCPVAADVWLAWVTATVPVAGLTTVPEVAEMSAASVAAPVPV
jgi:hypothetical protein